MKNLFHLTFHLSLLMLLSSCGLTERITQTRTVRVDTVYKEVSLPEHNFSEMFELQDSLFFEDDRLALSLGRVQPKPPKGDSMYQEKEIGAQQPNLWRIDAKVKPDTVVVPCEEKTVTDRTETTKYVKRTPGVVKYIIGGLVMLLLLAGGILYFTRR